MEIDQTPPLIAKKLCKFASILFQLLKKGLTNCKLLSDLHSFIKRWKLAGKSITQIIHHLHQDYACNSTDVRSSIVSRRDYEFSCSNSPAYSSYFKRKNNSYRYRPEEIKFVQKVFDVLNNYDVVESSPVVLLPGFGHSPLVRQLRVTDSPFPVKEAEENPQVDKDAEEFIKKFYSDLNKQGRLAALEPPSPHKMWER